MPVGAFGGKRAIMEKIAPLGPVYQAGTLSGNPVAVAAGLATLAAIEAPGFYDRLAATTRALTDGLAARGEARRRRVLRAIGRRHVRPLFRRRACPTRYDAGDGAATRTRFNRFFHAMLDAGVYLAPSAFEAGFVSAAHSRRATSPRQRCRVADLRLPRVLAQWPRLVSIVTRTLEAAVRRGRGGKRWPRRPIARSNGSWSTPRGGGVDIPRRATCRSASRAPASRYLARAASLGLDAAQGAAAR